MNCNKFIQLKPWSCKKNKLLIYDITVEAHRNKAERKK